MAGLFDGVASSYLLGSAIGERVRSVSRTSKINKATKQYAELESQAKEAEAANDAKKVAELRLQQSELAQSAIKARGKMNLAEEGSGDATLSNALVGGAGQYKAPSAIRRPTMNGADLSTATSDENSAIKTAMANPVAQDESGWADAPAPNRDVEGVADPYGQSRMNAEYANKFSNAAGIEGNPFAMEEIGVKAIPKLYGEVLEPILARAEQEQKTNGKWSDETADEMAAALKTMSIYMPNWKGAVIQVQADNSLFIDPTGGEGTDGYTVSDIGQLREEYKNIEKAALGPSNAIAINRASNEVAAKEQKDRLNKMTESQLKIAENLMTKWGVTPIDIKSFSDSTKNLVKAGVTVAPLPEEQSAGGKFKAKVTFNGNDYFVGDNVMKVNGEDTVTGPAFYDVATGNQIDAATWQKHITDARLDKSVNNDITSLFKVSSAFDQDKNNQILHMVGGIFNAAANGGVADFGSLTQPPTTQESSATAAPAAPATPATPAMKPRPATKKGATGVTLSGSPEEIISGVMGLEGGLNMKDATTGMPVNFGIDQKAHPEVDVTKLTAEDAARIYKKDYWDKFNIGSLPPAIQGVAMDAVVNHGGSAMRMVEAANGDPQKLIDLRREKYLQLAKANPQKYGPSLNGWMNRMSKLESGLDSASGGLLADTTAPAIKAPARSRQEALAAQELATHPGSGGYDQPLAVDRAKQTLGGGLRLSPDYMQRLMN